MMPRSLLENQFDIQLGLCMCMSSTLLCILSDTDYPHTHYNNFLKKKKHQKLGGSGGEFERGLVKGLPEREPLTSFLTLLPLKGISLL